MACQPAEGRENGLVAYLPCAIKAGTVSQTALANTGALAKKSPESGARSERHCLYAAACLDEPALAVKRLVVEPGRHPVCNQRLREWTEIGGRNLAD